MDLRGAVKINRDYSDLLSAFVAHRVRFLIVGAYALAYHGRPRATGDLDVWVEASRSNARRVYAALAAFGPPVERIEPEDTSPHPAPCSRSASFRVGSTS